MDQFLLSTQGSAKEVLLGFLILIVIVLFVFFKTAKGKGILGEWRVRFRLWFYLRKKAIFINNFIYEDEEYRNVLDPSYQKTVQIDHIVIGTFGVLVIETKNYAGRIYGNRTDREWTQVLKNGEVKNRFYNPILQNETHCRYVGQIVGEWVPIRSVVVFIRNNTEYISSAGEVVNLNALKGYLRELPNLLTKEQIVEIADKLQSVNQSGIISNRQHTKNVKRLMEEVDIGICPRCGGALVHRNGKYGDFFGCENYPKCTFKKKL